MNRRGNAGMQAEAMASAEAEPSVMCDVRDVHWYFCQNVRRALVCATFATFATCTRNRRRDCADEGDPGSLCPGPHGFASATATRPRRGFVTRESPSSLRRGRCGSAGFSAHAARRSAMVTWSMGALLPSRGRSPGGPSSPERAGGEDRQRPALFTCERPALHQRPYHI